MYVFLLAILALLTIYFEFLLSTEDIDTDGEAQICRFLCILSLFCFLVGNLQIYLQKFALVFVVYSSVF